MQCMPCRSHQHYQVRPSSDKFDGHAFYIIHYNIYYGDIIKRLQVVSIPSYYNTTSCSLFLLLVRDKGRDFVLKLFSTKNHPIVFTWVDENGDCYFKYAIIEHALNVFGITPTPINVGSPTSWRSWRKLERGDGRHHARQAQRRWTTDTGKSSGNDVLKGCFKFRKGGISTSSGAVVW